MQMRIEKDSLGTLEVPAAAYYGAQTARAVINFPISGQRAHPDFIWASAATKYATAKANQELGLISKERGFAIMSAAQEVMAGKFNDQFVVDVYQAGAGTSHHMNTNEVIANRAIEMLGGQRGEYKLIHPNDHVNFGQSTNDVFPTAMRIAILKAVPRLLDTLVQLENALQQKSVEFADVIKSGRTHLQDAVPVTLGQEFEAYAKAIHKARQAILSAADDLKELGIGGSAVGSGLNTHPNYRDRVVEYLGQLLALKLSASDNLFEAMQSMRPFAAFSGALRECALELTRIANDVRLLSSGPNTGLNEIMLPPVQPGSSIMPGKVNPVMAEMLNMVCFQVIGNDATVALSVQAGQLELNVMMPVIIWNILHSMEILGNAVAVFVSRCIVGIRANREVCYENFANSLGLATVLNVIVGYEKAADVMKEALGSHKTVIEVIREQNLLTTEQIESIFSAEKLTKPGVPKT